MDVTQFKRALEISKEIETLTKAYEGVEYPEGIYQNTVRNWYACNTRLLTEAADFLRQRTKERINELQREFAEL